MLLLALLLQPSFPDISELHCQFLTGSQRIVLEIDPKLPQVDPMESCERLFLVERGKWLRIDSLGDLKGKVRIENPEAALQFVRLFTTTFTWWTARPGPFCTEVISKPQIGATYTFSDSPAGSFLSGDSNNVDGIVTPALAERLHARASVIARGPHFIVHRLLLEQKNYLYGNLKRVVEEVGADGSYRVLGARYEKTPNGVSLSFTPYL